MLYFSAMPALEAPASSAIRAADKPWNSATTLYIARKINAIGAGRKLSILDVGCGEGVVMEQILDSGHSFYGYDLSYRKEKLRERLGNLFKEDFEDRIRIAPDERTIPFADATFDVVYANQVFEHVKFIDRIFSECARVLKPDGVLITLFPLATYPVELHSKVPFAHWLPPGRLRVAWLRIFQVLRLSPRRPGMNARQSAEWWDETLRTITYYRFMNEIQALAEHYFESWETDSAAYIR
ncbi:MAG TPA: class I SAM-dependent methyltransferase, partial [Planctomycetota bacterium]|nr:class I SAM-dependent methyltransferase [Planctomycetota bacterium]